MKCPECGHEFEEFEEEDAIKILKKILDKLERPVYIWPETTPPPTYPPHHGQFTGDPMPPQGETWCEA